MNVARHNVATLSMSLLAGTALAFGSVGLASDAWACQACACGDATFAVRPGDPNTHTLTAQLQLASRGERYGDDLPWAFREWRTDLTVGWGYQRTTVALRLPWVWRHLDYEGMRTNKTAGLGDIELAASYVLTKFRSEEESVNAQGLRRTGYVALHAGFSLPTAQLAVDNSGEPIIDDVQSGTGSFTPFAGLNWSVGLHGFRLDGRHTMYLPLPGRFSFQVGPTLQQRIRVMAEPLEQFHFGFAAYGSLAAPVKVGDELEDDTGGFIGYLDLEAEIIPHEQLTFVVGARLPVIQALRGHHRADPGGYFGIRYQQPVKARRTAEPDAPIYL